MVQTSPFRETELRRFVAAHLDLIEPGMTLVAEEYPLQNQHGSGGFVDILARDASGDLVVIELKRSDQSARQALHELEKYVALLTADRGIRVDRMRCILLSTEWRELLVPFARFVEHVDFYVVGRHLVIGSDRRPVASEVVELPTLTAGLETCPFQLHLLYETREQRDEFARVIPDALERISVEDFITFNLDLGVPDDHVLYPHGTALVLATFSEAMRDHIRSLFPELCDDEPASPWWHEQVVQSEVVAAGETGESRVLLPSDSEAYAKWELSGLVGHGRYADSVVWPEAQLKAVVEADGEALSASFRRTVAVANKPAWQRMRRTLDAVIEGCGRWPESIAALLDELELHPNAQLSITAYAPADILRSLEAIVRYRSPAYMPQELIEWRDGPRHGVIGGKLTWDGITRVRTPQETAGAIFEDFSDYVFASSVGATREYETQMVGFHGLRYDLVESSGNDDDTTPQPLSRVSLIDGELVRSPLSSDEPEVSDFIAAHQDYLALLAAAFEASIARR